MSLSSRYYLMTLAIMMNTTSAYTIDHLVEKALLNTSMWLQRQVAQLVSIFTMDGDQVPIDGDGSRSGGGMVARQLVH